MLRAQRRDPAMAQAKYTFATNYPLANRQLRSPLILRYWMQRDKPLTSNRVQHVVQVVEELAQAARGGESRG